MKHEFQLIDGIVWNENTCKQVTLRPLDESTHKQVLDLVDNQLSHLETQPGFYLVNDSHRQGLKGYMTLNECAAISISHIGNDAVQMTFGELCQLNISAQDWNRILTANLALAEFYGEDEIDTMMA
ncbi:6-phospho-beta-glucosidase [Vibrio splendidus]|uniref:6-phospho-beta-glucosidase n=1 Tax=Vibrio splendidus TaxID=29497 RepID=UPI00352F4034